MKKYSPEEHQEIMEADLTDLNPAEFFYRYKIEEKENASAGHRKNMVEADDLYGLFCYYEKSRKSSNQLVKHIRAEGTSCSNERARELFPKFEERYLKEQGEQDET